MKKIIFLISFIFSLNTLYAQPYKTIKVFKPYKWMVGVSWSAIDDDGRKFSGMFDYAKSWNILPYPTKISLDRYFKYGWSAELSANYSQYLPGKMVQCSTDVTSMFICVDINAKYSFYQRYAPRARWIEPYFTMGAGYTYRSSALVSPHVPTINLGFGMNFWVYKNFGVRLHSNGKIGIYPNFWSGHTNYFQHSAGLVFRWKSAKTKSEFSRRKNKWAHGNKNYKKKGGH